MLAINMSIQELLIADLVQYSFKGGTLY